MTQERMTPALEACPNCDTPLVNAPGIGPYCPNSECPVSDGPLVWNTRASPAPEPVAAMEPVAWQDHPDLTGHMADAIRDAALHHVGKVIGFDASSNMAAEVLEHLRTHCAHPPADPLMDEVREAGRFLLDRLVDYEVHITSDEDGREFVGHVIPAMARFRAALAKLGERT